MEGGLGFKNLEGWNLALISKNLWNIQAERVHQNYLQNSFIWDYNGCDQDLKLMKHVLVIRDKSLAEERSIQAARNRMDQWVVNGKFNSKEAYEYFRPRGTNLTLPKLE